MPYAKHFPELMNDNDIMLGDGFLFIGTAGDVFDDEALESAGCLEGTATFKPIMEVAELKAGSPRGLIKTEPVEVGCELTITLMEINLKRLRKAMGYGTLATAVAATQTVTDEDVTLNGLYYHHMQGYNVKASPAVVVESTDSTPVPYTENVDYKINYTNGLIRRLADSTITDGDTVHVTYSWDQPAVETLSIGCETSIDVYPIKFIVPKPDGKRWYFRMWRGVPTSTSQLDFSSGDYTKWQVTYKAEIDRTQEPEEAYYRLTNEIGTYYAV